MNALSAYFFGIATGVGLGGILRWLEIKDRERAARAHSTETPAEDK